MDGKRNRADSAETHGSSSHKKRPRAVDIPEPVRAAPASWALLSSQIHYAWKYNTTVAKTIRDGAQSLMRDEDLSSRIVTQLRQNSIPKFKTIPERMRPTQNPIEIKQVYLLYPTILTSSNAKETQAGDPPPNPNVHHSSVDSVLPTLITMDFNREQKPLRCRVEKVDSGCVAPVSGPNLGFTVGESTRARVREAYVRFHEEELAFAADMGRLRILAPQNLSNLRPADETTVPHPLITLMFSLVHEELIRRLLNTDSDSSSTIVEKLNNFYRNLADATACADMVLLRALDACAILGGVELPQWPPSTEWRGAAIDPKSLPALGVEPSEDAHRFLAGIRRLERWGVPIWSFGNSGAKSRFDVTPEGLPSADEMEEGLFQGMLKSLVEKGRGIQCTTLLKLAGRVHAEGDRQVAVPGVFLRGPERRRLQRAIVALIDHDSPYHTNFASFSAIAQDILGDSIWTGGRHEAELHPAQFDVSQQMPWTRVRDGIWECAHVGVNVALFQIPLPWISSTASVASLAGEYISTETYRTSLAVVARGTWFILEVDDFVANDQSNVQGMANRFSPEGLYGWTFVQSAVQLKDSDGKTIHRSRFTLRFLFKQQHVQEHVRKAISTDLPNNEQRMREVNDAMDDFLFTFSYFVHPHFADVAYAAPISLASRTQVMQLAPPFIVVPSSSGSKERAAQVKECIHSLRHFELLEVGRFPPLIAPSGLLDPPPSSSPRVGLDMSSCSTATLINLASSAIPNGELSFMDVCRMQRLAYIVEILAKDGTFLCRVFRSNGPYMRILRYLSSTIRDRSPAGSSFTSRLNRTHVGPLFEAIRFTAQRQVEIILNLDTTDHDVELPTQDEFDKYTQTVEKVREEFLRKPSKSESRRLKADKRIAAGIAAGASGSAGSSH